MRDWNTQRMTEKRGNCKPVCQPANHARLGEGSEETPMRMDIPFKVQAKHEQHRHQGEQCCRDAAHLPELRIAPVVTFAFRLVKLAGRFYHQERGLACWGGQVTPLVATPGQYLRKGRPISSDFPGHRHRRRA